MTGSASSPPVIAWFRRDLRLSDNPAWRWACGSGRPVLPLFVFDEEGDQPLGGASRWWLHGSLQALDRDLRQRGSRLVLRRGPAGQVVPELARSTGAEAVTWNRLHEPATIRRDAAVEARCRADGVGIRTFLAGLLFEPSEIRTGSGSPYRVFTPFWRKCLEGVFRAPVEAPRTPAPPDSWTRSDDLESWKLRCRKPDWAAGFREVWQPGNAGARERLRAFLAGPGRRYDRGRDQPGTEGTSRLSPHLHFGEISPRQVAASAFETPPGQARDVFLRELGWREFSHHLLFHHPDMGSRSLRPEFDRMPWRDAPRDLRRWQRGRTGYPLVDAGMRELWTTGWMHNRVRMVVASFLTKHLLVDWRHGAAWFLDTLVDADMANNSAGWQWVAGSGADAAPWFRIFHPVTQSRRHDPDGSYLRKWLPDLRRLHDRDIHAPWLAPGIHLAEAGVRLGDNWPRPMVDHDTARRRALDAFQVHVRRQPTARG